MAELGSTNINGDLKTTGDHAVGENQSVEGSSLVQGDSSVQGDSNTDGVLKEKGQRVYSPNNRNISDSISSSSSTGYASQLSVKKAYDKGNSALVAANTKLGKNEKAVDADKLDGINSSVFARKDQDIITGSTVVSAGVGKVAITANDGKGNANVTFNHVRGIPMINGNAGRVEFNVDETTNPHFNFEMAGNVSSGVMKDLTTVLTLGLSQFDFKGNKIWHAGNDGSGSGLDADKLDGQHGSYYAKASQVLTNVPAGAVFTDTQRSISNSVSSTSATVAASSNAARIAYNKGLEALNKANTKLDDNGLLGGAGGLAYWASNYIVSATNVKELLNRSGASLNVNGIYRVYAHIGGTGTKNGSVAVFWYEGSEWKVNVSSTTGLNANIPEFTVHNGKPSIKTRHANDYQINVYHEHIHGTSGTGGNSHRGMAGADGYLSDIGGNLFFRSTSKVWHAGNDGSGSGLDADKLDGQHGSYYAKASQVLTNVPAGAKFTDTQRNITDSVTSTNTGTSASAKAVKTAYDKGVQALNTANGKLGLYSKAADSDKLDGLTAYDFARQFFWDAGSSGGTRRWIKLFTLGSTDASITGRFGSGGDYGSPQKSTYQLNIGTRNDSIVMSVYSLGHALVPDEPEFYVKTIADGRHEVWVKVADYNQRHFFIRDSVYGGVTVHNGGTGTTTDPIGIKVKIHQIITHEDPNDIVKVDTKRWIGVRNVDGSDDVYIEQDDANESVFGGTATATFKFVGDKGANKSLIRAGYGIFEDSLDAKKGLFVSGNKVWHSGNDGAGSGLDADKLDGLNSSNFARLGLTAQPNTYLYVIRNSTASTLYTVQSGSGDIARFIKGGTGSTESDTSVIITNSGGVVATGAVRGSIFVVPNPNNSQATVTCGWHLDKPRLRVGGGGVGATSAFSIQSTGDINMIEVSVADAFIGQNKHKAWHAGNDGNLAKINEVSNWTARQRFPSFEDATTNIGKTATELKTYTASQWGGVLGRSEMIRLSSAGAPSSAGSYAYWTVLGKRDTSGGYSGLLMPYTLNNDLFVGSAGTATEAPRWSKVWTDRNDGSGSGLDADKLDGYQAVDFLRKAMQKYDTQNGWFRETGDDDHVRVYGNSRTVVMRTDGTTQYQTNGSYPFIWLYGGDGTANRLMLISNDGDLWLKKQGNWISNLLNAKASTSHNHDSAYLGKTATAADSNKLAGRSISTTATGNTVPLRDGSGDIYSRLFRSTYPNQSTISGAMAYRVSTSDNYIRFCSSHSAIRNWMSVYSKAEVDSLTGGSWTKLRDGAYTSAYTSPISLAGKEVCLVSTDNSSTDQINVVKGFIPPISGFASDTNYYLPVGKDHAEYDYTTRQLRTYGEYENHQIWYRTPATNEYPPMGTITHSRIY